MIEQWFLDLDGIRSGPYHTPEIMSLIAEGEVLPHHRISTSLHEDLWMSILDWRLDQAKGAQTFQRNPPESKIIPDEDRTVILSPEISHPEFYSLDEVAAAPIDSHSEYGSSSNPVTSPDLSPPPPSAPEQKPFSFSEIPMNPALEEKIAAIRDLEKTDPNLPRPITKRDPTAEMFDMLQKTKQKGDVKSTPAGPVGLTVEDDTPVKGKKSNALSKTIGIGVAITLLGFILGQFFQGSTPPTQKLNAAASATPAPSMAPLAPTSPEVLDRSTSKLTIRSKVEHRNDQTIRPSHSLPSQALPAQALSGQNPRDERELEELKSLKRELQDLKNMKNAPGTEEASDEGEVVEGTPVEPAFDADGNPIPYQNPNVPSGANTGGIPPGADNPPVR